MTTLDQALLDAHADDNAPALVQLYTQAADQAADAQAAGFYLTQAYVYALEHDDSTATSLFRRLKADGRV